MNKNKFEKQKSLIKSAMYLLVFCLMVNTGIAQTQKKLIYNPDANPKVDIANAMKIAQKEHKHILLQLGGNWCPWCIMLHQFCEEKHAIDSILRADYVIVKVNIIKKKESRNSSLLADLGYPQRFGFPVLLVLDENGNRLHTQNTVYLEEGKGYNEKKIIGFLKDWNKSAISPENYKTK